MINQLSVAIRSHCWRLIVAGLVIVFSASAGQAAGLSAVTIKLFDGSVLEGSIDAIDQQGNLQGEGFQKGVNLTDILSVETRRAIETPDSTSIQLYLVDGGKLLVQSPEIVGDKLSFQSRAGISQVPLQAIRGLVWKTSSAVETRLKQPSNNRDAVVVSTDEGDRIVAGIVEGLDSSQLQLNYKSKSRIINLAKIKAVVMADLGLELADGLLATINLIDGSQVKGIISGLADSLLKVTVSGGGNLDLKVSHVASFSIASDRIQFLSDLEPVDVQQSTEFAIQRPWKRDRSIENNPLQIRQGQSGDVIKFNKGLGTQAYTQLEFANTGNFDRFMAIVGIDAETRGRGDCKMVVRADGIELWSERVRGSDEPKTIDVDITGMKKISLIVYPGNEFDLADHADWGNARLVRMQ